MGLHRAGFEVEGWDIARQKHYPFTFHLGNALEADLSGFDFVWASPPCQAHTSLKTMPNARKHLDLIPATRAKLQAWGGPYVIENVPGAPLRVDVVLCGTMFGLVTADGSGELRRHRWFESNCIFPLVPPCQHGGPVIGVYGGPGKDRRRSGNCYGHAGGRSVRDGTQQFSTQACREAMGIDWMNGAELSQAIPPAYSEYLAKHVKAIL